MSIHPLYLHRNMTTPKKRLRDAISEPAGEDKRHRSDDQVQPEKPTQLENLKSGLFDNILSFLTYSSLVAALCRASKTLNDYVRRYAELDATWVTICFNKKPCVGALVPPFSTTAPRVRVCCWHSLEFLKNIPRSMTRLDLTRTNCVFNPLHVFEEAHRLFLFRSLGIVEYSHNPAMSDTAFHATMSRLRELFQILPKTAQYSLIDDFNRHLRDPAIRETIAPLHEAFLMLPVIARDSMGDFNYLGRLQQVLAWCNNDRHRLMLPNKHASENLLLNYFTMLSIN